MSHGRHNASSEIAHLLAEIRRMTAEEAFENHGIEIQADKLVYDSTYEQTFNNVQEWAAFVIEQERDNWEDDFDRDSNKWDEEDY